MGLLDNIKDKLFNRESADTGFMTDDEKELREYEEYYTPQSGVADGTYAEFVVSDVLTLSGRGTVVIGTVTGGVFRVHDEVVVVHGHTEIPSVITSIEQFSKICESVSEGANAGIILKDIDRKQVSRNDIIKKQISPV
ncbi:EF-Tu/IF-2/RF-3 family GTPase [Ruminococcus sp.]|uniref:EF-Tu/IF-2/RF-3 family GTPase n=1 Tax=Ruminococcus sp. TaxID=41978 RepID=UPI0025D28F70|nr:EF-Tu/IF-2/RF-3 family GTPase [Ruminococcus sp.]